MNKTLQILLWPALAILGAFSFAAIALNRGESVSAACGSRSTTTCAGA